MTGVDTPDGHVFFQGDHRLEGILEWPEPHPGGNFAVEGDAGPGAAGADSAGKDVRPGEGGPCSAGEGAPVKGGVVIAHPYPPHGATMAQPVVYRIAQSSRRRGFATLRFNFRGVGESLGHFSGTEEHRDVEAAAVFLAERLAARNGGPGRGSTPLPLALAGYSFGSVMVARAAAGAAVPVRALALVGFVVSWEHVPPDTFERLAAYRGPVLAVCAENDALGYPEDVERVLRTLRLDFRLSVVDGAGHFLEGRHREVGETVGAFLAETLCLGERSR